MTSELVRLCDPMSFFDSFLTEGVYPDGRPIDEYTAVSFKKGINSSVGSALIRQGGVTVSCSVSASIVLLNDGDLLIPEIQSCAEITEQTRDEILDTLHTLISKDMFFPRSALLCKGIDDSLVISWQLSVDIRILNANGGVTDAVIGAVSTALSDVRLPLVKLNHAKDDEAPIQKEEISILPKTYSISMTDFPVSTTFVVYQPKGSEGFRVLCDPPTECLKHCHSNCTVIAGKRGVLLLKTSGSGCDLKSVQQMIAYSEKRGTEVLSQML